MAPIPLKATLYIIGTVGLGSAIALCAAWGWRPDHAWLFAIFAVLSVLGSLLKIRLPGIQGASSVHYIVVIAAIAELNLAEVLAVAICGIVVQTYWRPAVRSRPIQAIFNAACVVNSSSAAFFVFHETLVPAGIWSGTAARLLAAALTYFVTNTLAVSVVIGFTERKSPFLAWSTLYFRLFPYYMAGASIAGAIEHWKALLSVEFALLMGPVVFAVYYSMSSHVKRLEEAKRHAEEKAALHLQTIEALELSKQQAEEASRLKSHFLTNISHELRTPMNAIMGMTELALDTPLDAEQLDYLETVQASAGSLLAIINDILDVADMQSNCILVNPVDCNLSAILEGVMEAMGPPARDKGLALNWRIDPTVPRFVRLDPGRLRQILVNIVGNAIKFTDIGSVSASIGCDPADDADLLFVVRDTGIGIAKEQQARILEAFTQADGSMTRRHGGAGLGLAISARLIEMMGGQIWIDSEMGIGSAFYFTVKWRAASETATIQSTSTRRASPSRVALAHAITHP